MFLDTSKDNELHINLIEISDEMKEKLLTLALVLLLHYKEIKHDDETFFMATEIIRMGVNQTFEKDIFNYAQNINPEQFKSVFEDLTRLTNKSVKIQKDIANQNKIKN